jgi:lysine/ornithine N-monooxygenase
MGQYFFKLTEEEKNNILDSHKTLYNGYSIKQKSSNTQPLYTQDFANDKQGITVNNRGEVSSYKNVGINENYISLGDDKKDDDIELESSYDDFNENEYEYEEQYEKMDYLEPQEEPKQIKNILDDIESEIEFEEDSERIKESVIDTLKWFKKLK